jgi:hypothetical protein
MDTTRRRRARLVPEGQGAPPRVSGLADRRVRGKPAGADVVSVPTLDLAAEDAYWREHFSARYYVEDAFKYADYAPAYRMGCQARFRFPAQEWERIESVLERAWPQVGRLSQLDWNRAKLAARDAWDRCSAPQAEFLQSDQT